MTFVLPVVLGVTNHLHVVDVGRYVYYAFRERRMVLVSLLCCMFLSFNGGWLRFSC